MKSESSKALVPKFFNKTAGNYDDVVAWATFRKDSYWKREILAKIESADSILDLACGTGILTRKLATKFPNSQITGVDITKSYLDIAKKNSSQFSNIIFVHQDAEKLTLDEKFDVLCSSYIPKYCDPKILIPKCLAHLNPGGKIVLHDFVFPKNKLIQLLWNLHFILLNLIGRSMPSWNYAFQNLPKLIKSSSWVRDYKTEFEKNGFKVLEQKLTWETSTILVATE